MYKILQEHTEKETNFLSFMGSAVLVKLHLMQNQQNWYLLYLICIWECYSIPTKYFLLPVI